MTRIVQITCLGKLGRFGNQLFQYAFARAYAEHHGATLEVPTWIGRELFGLDDPYPSCELPRTRKNRVPENGCVNIDLFGYFINYGIPQYWTHDQVRQWFKFQPQHLAQHCPPKAPYVAAHLRRGDFAKNLYRTCVIRRRAYERAILQFGLDSAKVVWVSEESGNPMVDDFLTLMRSDVLFLSNSTFSYWAGLLGQQRCFAPQCEGRTGWIDCDFVEGHRYVCKWASSHKVEP